MSQQLPTPLIFIWSEFGGELFGNNNPGNISIGLLSTQNKIYILYSLEIYESVCQMANMIPVDNNDNNNR